MIVASHILSVLLQYYKGLCHFLNNHPTFLSQTNDTMYPLFSLFACYNPHHYQCITHHTHSICIHCTNHQRITQITTIRQLYSDYIYIHTHHPAHRQQDNVLFVFLYRCSVFMPSTLPIAPLRTISHSYKLRRQHLLAAVSIQRPSSDQS